MPRTLALTCLVLVLGASTAPAACPTSELLVTSLTPVLVDTPTGEVNDVRDDVVYARAAFDLVSGWLQVIHPGSLAPTSVLARDAFEATGLDPGTPVPVRIQIAVEGTISTIGCGGSGCWGNLEAEIVSGDLSALHVASANLYAPETRPVQFVVELPVTLIAGQSTEIAFRLEGWRPPGGSHQSQGTGAFRFLDVPAGAAIVSCNGFTGSPTPVRAASWGGMKAAYR